MKEYKVPIQSLIDHIKKNFYECIEGTVDGKSICDWCDFQEECQLQAKGEKGCKEWEHRIQQEVPVKETADES